jgi:hypothetical protein
MLVAAHTAGGHSTLDVLIGLAVIMWALAAVALLVGWLWRLAYKRRARRGWDCRNGRLVGQLRARRNTQRASPVVADPSADTEPRAGQSSAAASQRASARAERATGPPPAIPGARLSSEQLEPLGQHLDGTRRFAVSEARVAEVLAALPADRWLVERYVLFDGHRVPFLILGETGVFALWATSGPTQWRELSFLDQIARRVENALPGYPGAVQPGVCRALEPDIKPRWWCRPGEPGAWVMGLDWLIRWLEHFGPENGLGVKDLERLRELAGPRWGHPVTDVPLSAHIPTLG